METYTEFLSRIDTFEKPVMTLDEQYFNAAPGLADKVRNDDTFRPFYGDTVVFDLDDNTKANIDGFIDLLYAEAPECFCERLVKNTIHMTLHDLSNSPDMNAVRNKMEQNCAAVKKLLADDEFTPSEIKMRSKAVFNMVGKSIVLGLYHDNENEYKKLMQLYETADKVMQLPYPFTPHITLAYYAVKGFDVPSVKKLTAAVNELNTRPLEITLSTDRLVYQHFSSMNDYRNVLFLGR